MFPATQKIVPTRITHTPRETAWKHILVRKRPSHVCVRFPVN